MNSFSVAAVEETFPHVWMWQIDCHSLSEKKSSPRHLSPGTREFHRADFVTLLFATRAFTFSESESCSSAALASVIAFGQHKRPVRLLVQRCCRRRMTTLNAKNTRSKFTNQTPRENLAHHTESDLCGTMNPDHSLCRQRRKRRQADLSSSLHHRGDA